MSYLKDRQASHAENVSFIFFMEPGKVVYYHFFLKFLTICRYDPCIGVTLAGDLGIAKNHIGKYF